MRSIFRGGVMLGYQCQKPSPKFASLCFANFDPTGRAWAHARPSDPPKGRVGLRLRRLERELLHGFAVARPRARPVAADIADIIVSMGVQHGLMDRVEIAFAEA